MRILVMRLLPSGLRPLVRGGAARLLPRVKNQYELNFWDDYNSKAGLEPDTDHYRTFMMRMGDIKDISFFDGKLCLDVGCGPRGSLTWLTNAKAALGLDPLAEAYARYGIHSHGMIYLYAPVERIPLPSRYADVVFSMNSLDHVDNLHKACDEIRRVLKPGGHFIGSLNLNEPASICEPWPLSEDYLAEHLFKGWEREFYKVRPKVHDNDPYRYFQEDPPSELIATGKTQALWCRVRVPK